METYFSTSHRYFKELHSPADWNKECSVIGLEEVVSVR